MRLEKGEILRIAKDCGPWLRKGAMLGDLLKVIDPYSRDSLGREAVMLDRITYPLDDKNRYLWLAYKDRDNMEVGLSGGHTWFVRV
jgi:hypothetical protein